MLHSGTTVVNIATAITNVRVFDGERPGELTTVMIDDGVIVATRPAVGIAAGERGAQRIIDEAAGTPVRAPFCTDPLDSRLALTTWSRET
jgi:hypothetical protein